MFVLGLGGVTGLGLGCGHVLGVRIFGFPCFHLTGALLVQGTEEMTFYK